jgi:hypothetical protein
VTTPQADKVRQLLSRASSALPFSAYSFCVHHPVNRNDRHLLDMQWPLTYQSYGKATQYNLQLFLLFQELMAEDLIRIQNIAYPGSGRIFLQIKLHSLKESDDSSEIRHRSIKEFSA